MIIVIVEESQRGEDILMYVFSASGVEDSLFLLGWTWAISNKKRLSVVIIINWISMCLIYCLTNGAV